MADYQSRTAQVVCQACKGRGYVSEYRYFNKGKNKIISTKKCLFCKGTGYVR